MPRSTTSVRLVVPLALLAWLTACGGTTTDDGDAQRPASTTTTIDLEGCATDASGTLTVAADEEPNEPWYEGGDPTSGGGMEGALVVALAERLGYAPGDLEWTSADLDDVDLELDGADLAIGGLTARTNQYGISLTEEAYYEVPLALLATTTDPDVAGGVSTPADLELGTLDEPAAIAEVDAVLDLEEAPTPLGSLGEALEALDAGEVDALVVPLTSALGVARANPERQVLGQFPPSGDGAKLAIGIADGSDLGPCVDAALRSLIDDGTVAELQARWMGDDVAPLLPTS